MQEPGKLLLHGLLLMIIYSSFAQGQDCIEFTKIAYNDIIVSWNTSCFGDDTLYHIELHGEPPCNIDEFECGTNPCEFRAATACLPPAIPKGCSSVSLNITGESDNRPEVHIFNVAPQIRSDEWNLKADTVDSLLHVTWGSTVPSNNDLICADTANVVAECLSDVGELVNKNYILDPPGRGSADVNISSCNDNVKVTVTYMSEGILTETKDTVTFEPDLEPVVITDVTEVSNEPSQLEVTWSAVAYGSLSGYLVIWEVKGAGLNHTTDPSATSYTITGLEPCTEYTVNVAAISQTGSIGPEATAPGSTGIDAPGAPLPNIVDTESTSSSLLVSWNQDVANECPITKYIVEWSAASDSGTSASGNIGVDKTSFTIVGLSSSTDYNVTVTAYTSDDKLTSTIITGKTKAKGAKNGGGLSGGEIAGIVIGCLLGVALIGLGIFYCYKKKKLCFEI